MHKTTRANRQLLATIAGVCACASAQAANVSGPAPSWVTNIAPGTWSAVSLNTISDVDPADDAAANPNYPNTPPWSGNTGQIAVTTTWNGGAFAERAGPKGSLIMWGGGHKDYYGNEVYAFSMETRRWTRESNPYRNVSFPVSNGIWPDGSPSVPHTYSMSSYHPPTNSFVCLNTQSSNSPSNVTVPVLFSFASKSWRRGPVNSQTVIWGGFTVYDPTRDVFWHDSGATGPFARYAMNGDGTQGTWTTFSGKVGSLDSRAALDKDHDIIVATSFRDNTNVWGIDLKNPSAAAVLLRQGGSPPTRSRAHGWDWSATRQAFIYWNGGTAVHEFKLSGSDWKTATWNWAGITSSGSTTTPSSLQNGIYSRFQVVTYDDAEVAVVVNEVNGPVYAFRMPGGPPIRPNPPAAVQAQ